MICFKTHFIFFNIRIYVYELQISFVFHQHMNVNICLILFLILIVLIAYLVCVIGNIYTKNIEKLGGNDIDDANIASILTSNIQTLMKMNDYQKNATRMKEFAEGSLNPNNNRQYLFNPGDNVNKYAHMLTNFESRKIPKRFKTDLLNAMRRQGYDDSVINIIGYYLLKTIDDRQISNYQSIDMTNIQDRIDTNNKQLISYKKIINEILIQIFDEYIILLEPKRLKQHPYKYDKPILFRRNELLNLQQQAMSTIALTMTPSSSSSSSSISPAPVIVSAAPTPVPVVPVIPPTPIIPVVLPAPAVVPVVPPAPIIPVVPPVPIVLPAHVVVPAMPAPAPIIVPAPPPAPVIPVVPAVPAGGLLGAIAGILGFGPAPAVIAPPVVPMFTIDDDTSNNAGILEDYDRLLRSDDTTDYYKANKLIELFTETDINSGGEKNLSKLKTIYNKSKDKIEKEYDIVHNKGRSRSWRWTIIT